MNNLFNPSPTKYYPINDGLPGNDYLIAGGAAGWVQTDISASSVPVHATAICFRVAMVAPQAYGARPHAAAFPGPFLSLNTIYSFFQASIDKNLSMDFYREATANDYTIIGYWA